MKYYFHNGLIAGEDISQKEVERYNHKFVTVFGENEREKHKLIDIGPKIEYCKECDVEFNIVP